jgi:hypothetical protein
MRARKHPLSGRISCAECGARYNVTCETKEVESKGKLLHFSYPLLIHPRPTNCKSVARRVPLDLIEDILEDEYEEAFGSKETPIDLPLDPIEGILGNEYGKTCSSRSGAYLVSLSDSSVEGPLYTEDQNERLPRHLAVPVGDSMNHVDRQVMLDETVELIATARQVSKDLSENIATVWNTIDDVYKMMQQWEFLMLAWKPFERGIGAAPEAGALDAPVPMLPETSSGEYRYLEAIDSATISGKFDLTSIDNRTPRVLHLKFRGKESRSIPLDEE